MKKYCINLEIRQDRKERFIADNESKLGTVEFLPAVSGEALSYSILDQLEVQVDHKWRDPILGRRLTKGEIGCLISHVLLWQKCVDLKEPIMVFEDDAVVQNSFDEKEIEGLVSQGYTFIYLGHREMETPVREFDKYVVPSFAYLTHGYVLTPEAAKILLAGLFVFGTIPADELIPRCFNRLNLIAYKEDVVTQLDRSISGSDIEPTSEDSYFPFREKYCYTVATNVGEAHRLVYSSSMNDIELNILGKGLSSFDMTGMGGGIKVNLLREALKNHDDDDLILFLDGYDTFVVSDFDTIEKRFLGFNCDILFSAETSCWPDESLADQFVADTPYKYLNSGTFIGRAGALKVLLSESIEDTDDDQLYMTKQYLTKKLDIRLDNECYIFQTHSNAAEIKDDMIFNPETGCYSCIYHGNGGDYAITKLDELFNEWKNPTPVTSENKAPYISKNLRFEPVEVKKQIHDDMFVTSFLNQEMCDYLIKVGDENGSWEPLPYDKFPAQEIRVKELGLWEDFSGIWDEEVSKVYENIWSPIEHYGLRDAFVMKYTVDTQKELPLHHDASLVTGSVKLNDNYKGADLWFPRQRVTNHNVPVGDMILFPGQVTHGHECLRLEDGTKYSLTMWTKRHPGDSI